MPKQGTVQNPFPPPKKPEQDEVTKKSRLFQIMKDGAERLTDFEICDLRLLFISARFSVSEEEDSLLVRRFQQLTDELLDLRSEKKAWQDLLRAAESIVHLRDSKKNADAHMAAEIQKPDLETLVGQFRHQVGPVYQVVRIEPDQKNAVVQVEGAASTEVIPIGDVLGHRRAKKSE